MNLNVSMPPRRKPERGADAKAAAPAKLPMQKSIRRSDMSSRLPAKTREKEKGETAELALDFGKSSYDIRVILRKL